jgi:hypothetical protein
MSDTLRDAAKAVRQQLDEKVAAIKSDPAMAEVLKLQAGLNALESLAGDPSTTLAQLFGMDRVDAPAAPLIRADEFYGLAPLEAAKRYLKKRGEARQFDDILASIRAGGCRVESEEDLRLSLARSTYEVAKISENLYGLVEFYSHIKRERGKKKKGLSEGQDAEIEREETAEQIERDAAALAEGGDEGEP